MNNTSELIARAQAKAKAEKNLKSENPFVCMCGREATNQRDRDAFYRDLRQGRPPRQPECNRCIQARRDKATQERMVYAQKLAEQKRAEDLAMVRRNPVAILGTCNVPLSLQNARLELCDDIPPKIMDTVREWAENPSGFLVFSGVPGAGKSYLAVACLRDMLVSGQVSHSPQPRFIAEADWLATVMLDYGNPVRDETPHHAPLLIFDDLGAGFLNDLRRAEVESMIRTRHAKNLPTIITTNCDVQELGDKLGGRVLSVIRANRSIIRFPERDLRLVGSGKVEA